MEDKEYGNVYEVGLKEAYARTMNWRNESYLYEGCKGCHYIDVCQSGCRMHGMAATGKMDQKDPLMPGKEFITKPYKLEKDTQIEEKIKSGAFIHVPESIRFRYEEDEDFYLMNIRWGNLYINLKNLDTTSIKKISNIKLVLKNKHQILNEDIIFKKKNCYYTK
jgi:hypothetical protein